MQIAAFGACTIRLLEPRHATALQQLQPGDLTQAQGEWIVAAGQEERFIAESLQHFAEGRGFWSGIWQGEVLVGILALREIKPHARSASIGYALDARHRGRGIMTEACRAIVTYGFTEVRLNRIQIMTDPDNTPSCRIPERLGFTQEGELRDFYRSLQGYRTGRVYSLLAREWDPVAGAKR